MVQSIKISLLAPLWDDGPIGLLLLFNGLKVTLVVAFFAVLLGLLLGTFTAVFRMSSKKILSIPAKIYTEIVRGTPVMVQLLIIYFILFRSFDLNQTTAGIIAFGINSGAYISEIIRAGIQAVDKGQMEAARSLGMPLTLSMRIIILPQAIKNILPALGNEFVVLLKETAILGFIGGNDLMRAGNKIRSVTYEATVPLFAVAISYFIITYFISLGISRFERKLKNSD
ncbi:MAG: amino acid ABC transporter permease [Spirochaetaceae bacterium 4572_7]|nr:MAG: amino acid ABC transporter permease [Spirochaetaceae bacterium 4572_7]